MKGPQICKLWLDYLLCKATSPRQKVKCRGHGSKGAALLDRAINQSIVVHFDKESVISHCYVTSNKIPVLDLDYSTVFKQQKLDLCLIVCNCTFTRMWTYCLAS